MDLSHAGQAEHFHGTGDPHGEPSWGWSDIDHVWGIVKGEGKGKGKNGDTKGSGGKSKKGETKGQRRQGQGR